MATPTRPANTNANKGDKVNEPMVTNEQKLAGDNQPTKGDALSALAEEPATTSPPVVNESNADAIGAKPNFEEEVAKLREQLRVINAGKDQDTDETDIEVVSSMLGDTGKTDIKNETPVFARIERIDNRMDIQSNGMVIVPGSVRIAVKIPTNAKARLKGNATIDMIYDKQKIGSSFAKGGKSALRGLTLAEELKFLPIILAVSPNSDKWQNSVENYWRNISKLVPAATGLTFDISMVYQNKNDAAEALLEADEQAELKLTARKNGRNHNESFETRTRLGQPMNVEDYILYRYCLVYGDVARHVDDMYKSANIRFYLIDSAVEKDMQRRSHSARLKATRLYMELLTKGDDVKENVILLLKNEIRAYNELPGTTDPIDTSDPIARDIALETLANKYPVVFSDVVTDKALDFKAFVEKAIQAGELRRLPNTDAIVHGANDLIGNNVNEAIAYLQQESAKPLLMTIRTRLKMLGK